MAYESQSKNQKKSVTTTGQKYYNSDSATPCALTMAYWDDMVRVGFAKQLPQAQQTQFRKFDYDNEVITAIRRAKANALVDKFHKEFVPALQKGEDCKISITVGQANQLQVDTNIDAEGVPHPTLRLIKDISPDTLTAIPGNILEYEFNNTEIVYGYNPTDGTFKTREFIFGELELFFRDMNSAVEASSNAYVHTDRVVKRYQNDLIHSKLNQIGGKLGLTLDNKPQYASNGNGGQGSIFDQSKQGTQNAGGYSVPSQSIGSIEDLNNAIDAN